MLRLSIPEMKCQHCVDKVSQCLKKLDYEFEIKLSEKLALVAADEDAFIKISECLEAIGYDVVKL